VKSFNFVKHTFSLMSLVS